MYHVDSLFIYTTRLNPGLIVKIGTRTFKGASTKEIKRIISRGKVLQGINQEQFWQQAHKIRRSS